MSVIPFILDPVEHPETAAGEAQRLIDRLRLYSNDPERRETLGADGRGNYSLEPH